MDTDDHRWETIADRLRGSLRSVIDGVAALIGQVNIEWFDRDGGGVVYLVAAEYRFGELTPALRARQVEIKRSYDRFADLVRVLLGAGPAELLEEWKTADYTMRMWIELGGNDRLTKDRARNERELRSDGASVEKILAVLGQMGDHGVIIVPDTSSLLNQPDPVAYRSVAGAEHFAFLLLPTVLGELDELQIGKSERTRDLATKAKTRISGWRDVREAGSSTERRSTARSPCGRSMSSRRWSRRSRGWTPT